MKSSAFILLILFPFFLINGSCKKSLFKRHAKGRVVDRFDGKPIPHAKITIVSDKDIITGVRREELATTECDGNGEFEVSYQTIRDGTNYLFTEAEHYYFIDDDVREVSRGTRKSLEVFLTPKSHLTVNVNITDPTIKNVYFNLENIYIGGSFDARFGKTQKVFETIGDREYSYNYTIYYNIIVNNNVKSEVKLGRIVCPKLSNDTASVNINL